MVLRAAQVIAALLYKAKLPMARRTKPVPVSYPPLHDSPLLFVLWVEQFLTAWIFFSTSTDAVWHGAH